jgi:hypothetical protein
VTVMKLALVLLLVTACSSSASAPPDAASLDGAVEMVPAGGDGAAPADAATDSADQDGGTLVSGAVCKGVPGDCPANPPPSGSACAKNLLCCVYQPAPNTLAGCTCFQGNWVCAPQACGCP